MFLCWSLFAKDVVVCFCHGSIKAVCQGVYFGVLIFKDEEWSKLSSYRCSKICAMLGSLSFSWLNLILVLLWIRPWDTLACCWDVKQPTNNCCLLCLIVSLMLVLMLFVFPRIKYNSRVPDSSMVISSMIIETHHSGREPSKFRLIKLLRLFTSMECMHTLLLVVVKQEMFMDT